eukprot:624902-Hanusia_phi.AAC.1
MRSTKEAATSTVTSQHRPAAGRTDSQRSLESLEDQVGTALHPASTPCMPEHPHLLYPESKNSCSCSCNERHERLADPGECHELVLAVQRGFSAGS